MGIDELCLGPRGFAKTTVRAVIRTIYKLTENPNEQLAIISDTKEQAVKFMSETKQQLESNEYLRILYPELAPGRIWTTKEISIAGATDISKEASVTALGVGQGTGSHFDDILLDDIVDFENVKTKYRRDDLEKWVDMSLMPMLKAGGTVHLNGTRYHHDDYYGRILEKGTYNNIQHKTHRAILKNGKSLWEQRWPIEKLLKIKEDRGSIAFNAQYQNDTTLMEQGSIFKREWFNYFKKDGEYFVLTNGKRILIKDIAFYQTCDLALSKKDTADYFVILTFGADREGNIYITNLLRGRFSWAEQKRLTPEHYRRNTPLNWLGIESNQYQAVLADEVNTLTDISIRQLEPVGDKVTRANSMSAKFETGKVFIWNKLPHLDEFEDELTTFPEGEHDDMVDTVGYIPQCIRRKRASVYVNV
jgi:predicted phage terminase large subunit-like protein